MNQDDIFTEQLLFALILCIPLLLGIIYLICRAYKSHDYKKHERSALGILNYMKGKGYEWAREPLGSVKVYILASRENVKRIGITPDNKILYETDSGKRFYSLLKISSVVIDVGGYVHESFSDGLVLQTDDLIIKKGYYVIQNKQEAHDFLILNDACSFDDDYHVEFLYDTSIIDESV